MIEVADILHQHFSDFLNAYSIPYDYYKVVNALLNCRTSALGSHVDICDDCGHEIISYNSCRNRHCPKCQQTNTSKWLLKQQESLLDVHYFHIVFTVPDILYPFMFLNQSFAYNLLFKAASETLLELSASKKFLNAKIGFTSVLHTWGQNLSYHPHLHCVVTGGGLDSTNSHFVTSNKDYFLPVKVLSNVLEVNLNFILRKLLMIL
jgi:plasmid rolling circle replication initiator protein Rep